MLATRFMGCPVVRWTINLKLAELVTIAVGGAETSSE